MRAARNESRRARPPAAASSRETQLPRPPARREAVPAPLPAGGAGDPAGRLPPAPASPAARRPRPAERTKGRSSGGRAAEAPAGGSGAVGAGPLRGRGRDAGRARWWGGRGARPRAAEREGAGRGARARCAGRVRLHLRDFSPCKLSPRERRLAPRAPRASGGVCCPNTAERPPGTAVPARPLAVHGAAPCALLVCHAKPRSRAPYDSRTRVSVTCANFGRAPRVCVPPSGDPRKRDKCIPERCATAVSTQTSPCAAHLSAPRASGSLFA